MNINEYITSNGKNLLPEYYYKYRVINTLGINTIKPLYDKLDFGEENTVVAYHNGLLGFVDTTTGKHITPIAFSHLSHFFEGLAEVEYNGENRYINKDGVFITKETARLLKKNN